MLDAAERAAGGWPTRVETAFQRRAGGNLLALAWEAGGAMRTVALWAPDGGDLELSGALVADGAPPLRRPLGRQPAALDADRLTLALRLAMEAVDTWPPVAASGRKRGGSPTRYAIRRTAGGGRGGPRRPSGRRRRHTGGHPMGKMGNSGAATEHDPRARLATRLTGADWVRGMTKAELGEELRDDPALRGLVARHLPDELYFSARDVDRAIPGHAWQEAQRDTRHDPTAPLGGDPVAPNLPRSADLAAGSIRRVTGQATRTVGRGAQLVGQAAGGAGAVSRVAGRVTRRPREGVTVGAAPAGFGVLPFEGIQDATAGHDQVVSVTTRGDDPVQAPVPPGPFQRVVPVALSATMEGLGQAYNRQPTKALAFAGVGLGLSTASGLNTWVVRTVFRCRHTRLGPERVRPFLLGLWTATYLANLVDAWSSAGAARATWLAPPSRPVHQPPGPTSPATPSAPLPRRPPPPTSSRPSAGCSDRKAIHRPEVRALPVVLGGPLRPTCPDASLWYFFSTAPQAMRCTRASSWS